MKIKLIKFFLGSYIGLRYGRFNRSESANSPSNEKVLKKIGNEQIASLYGTRFKSTPIFFIPDDHDYFENDDAEKELVTFPADSFSKDVFKKMADLFYPPLLDTPDGKPKRKIGRIRYDIAHAYSLLKRLSRSQKGFLQLIALFQKLHQYFFL